MCTLLYAEVSVCEVLHFVPDTMFMILKTNKTHNFICNLCRRDEAMKHISSINKIKVVACLLQYETNIILFTHKAF